MTFINILLYADDIVLLAKNEEDLQDLLLIVENWCRRWRLEVNLAKTNIMHVRSRAKQQSRYVFLFNSRPVPYCKTYKYLGCLIHENLDFKVTVQSLSDSASRALSSITTKMIKNGGFPLNVFLTLYKACVCSISDYGGEVFGFCEFESTKKLHIRAARSFLGVCKSTPHAGIISELNELLPYLRTQLKMVRHYHKMLSCSENIVAKKIFQWDKKLNCENVLVSWYSEVSAVFSDNGLYDVFESGNIFNLNFVIKKLSDSMLASQQVKLSMECSALPKLRTFMKFKDFENTAAYLKKPLSFIQRKTIAKTRLGCLAIRVETGCYARPPLPAALRICQICENPNDEIEDEFHFLFRCEKFKSERESWIDKLNLEKHISNYEEGELLGLALNDPKFVKITAQYIIYIFDVRSRIVNNYSEVIDRYHISPVEECPACN